MTEKQKWLINVQQTKLGGNYKIMDITHTTNFFIIGAMKTGSTTLYDYLQGHADIALCSPKEPGFFSRDERFLKGWKWYESLFERKGESCLYGDASTCYSRNLTYPDTIKRIHQHNPGAKFIYVVREPVDRAISHYKHRMEERRLTGQPIISLAALIANDDELLEAGDYALQLEKYFEFFTKDQFLILTFKELTQTPLTAIKKVSEFLGVNIMPTITIRANSSGTVYQKNTIRNILRSIRHLPIVASVVDILPVKSRSKVMGFLVQLTSNSFIGRKIGKIHTHNLPEINDKDLAFLDDYYRSSILNLHHITGVTLKA
jgi:hypothetical protein